MTLIMKKKLLLLLLSFLFINAVSQAQFPAPHSFMMSYDYYNYNTGEWRDCGGQWPWGSSYCTYFRWEAPDLSETDAKLKGIPIIITRNPTMTKWEYLSPKPK